MIVTLGANAVVDRDGTLARRPFAMLVWPLVLLFGILYGLFLLVKLAIVGDKDEN